MDHILKMCTHTFVYGSYKVTFVYFTTYNSVLNFYGGMSLKGQINKRNLLPSFLQLPLITIFVISKWVQRKGRCMNKKAQEQQLL